MKLNVRCLGLIAVIGLQCLAAKAHCAIPYALRSSLMRQFAFSPSFDFSKGYDGTWVQPVNQDSLTSKDVAKVIPANMQPTTDQGRVASQILDHSMSEFFNSDTIQRSSVGRTAKEVEKSMQAEAGFGGKEPDSIHHSVKFTMKATESRADLEYTGLTNAQLTYYVFQAKTNLEIREKVAMLGTNLVYNNIITSNETRNVLSVRWLF